MTLNNSMSITPSPPGHAKGVRFEHGSVLGGRTLAARVSSQWTSTLHRLSSPARGRARAHWLPRQGLLRLAAGTLRTADRRPDALLPSTKTILQGGRPWL